MSLSKHNLKTKKGFTLIELMVVIAIIGILATTLAPKMREQLAKAKDAKAVNFLGATRTVANMFLINEMTNSDSISDEVSINFNDILPKLDITTKGLISEYGGSIIVGGSRDGKNGKLKYGGTIDLVIGNNQSNQIQKFALDKIWQATAVAATTTLPKATSTTSTFKVLKATIRNANDFHLAGGIQYPANSSTSTSGLNSSTFSTEGKQWSAY